MEFKLRVEKDVGRTISAFANTYGGIMIFGVDPKARELCGLDNPDEESRRLRQELEECRPNPKPEQEFVRHDGKIFIVLKIEPFAYSQNPCFFKKHCFIRQGTTNLELAGEELVDFLKKRTLLNFEESKSRASMHDLNFEKVNFLLKKRKITTESLKEEDYKGILAGLHVANYNGEFFLKNAALLFFAKEPQKFFSNLEVRVVKYAGIEPELGSIKLDKQLYGTIPELIERAFNAVLDNIGKTFMLVGAERKEIFDYPSESLREIITNALGHRDYFEPQEVIIEIFDDRIQVTNPGGLLAGQSMKNFDRVPKHRNPTTYRLLRDLGLGEGLGLGVRLMRRQFREAKLPDPEFYEVGNAFQVIVYNRKSGKKRYLVDFENPRQKQALAYLQKNPSLKAAQYAKLVGVSQPTAVRDLNELRKQGKIRKVGTFRGAYYVLEKER